MILIFKGVNPVAKGKICGPAQGIPLPAAGDPRGVAGPLGGEVLAVVRSGCIWTSAFRPGPLGPDAHRRRAVRCAGDGWTILCYQPSALLRLYQKNPKYLNRLYLHTVFHCIFRHLWLRGRRDKRLWDLACDIAVENVIDGLGRKSVQRPLTWVRQHAYEEIIAQEKVAAAAPIYAGWCGRRPAFSASWKRILHRRPPPLAQRCPRTAPADACAAAPEDVAKNRRADADRAGTPGQRGR